MDFNGLIVSIEIEGGCFQGLQESGTVAIVTTLDDHDMATDTPAYKQNQFQVRGISGGLISPYESNVQFSLQSVSSEAYLAINSSDRTVMLSNEQFPPPDAFRFKFKQQHGPFSVEIPCSIEPLDQGPVRDAVDASITLSLCIRAMRRSIEKPGIIESQYIQQIGIIAALQQADAVTHDQPNGDLTAHGSIPMAHTSGSDTASSVEMGSDSEDKSNLDTKDIMVHVQEIIDSGDLEEVKEALGGSYRSDTLPKTTDSSVAMKIAKLFVILNELVYLRDLDYRDAIIKHAYVCKDDVNRWWSEDIDNPELTKWNTYFEEVALYNDQARILIEKVVSKLGLKFQPLCSLSQSHKISFAGPYCGAFYDDGDRPFIILAIKGTGTLSDVWTDLNFQSVAGTTGSPLKGQIHLGFYNGFFRDYPVGMRNKNKLESGLPFQMLRLQLWRLEKQILSARPRASTWQNRVQTWSTGHSLGGAYATVLWAALLDQPQMLDSTLRDLMTFGSPRVGDREFIETVYRLKGDRRIWRLVNGIDVVPRFYYVSIPSGVMYYHPDTLLNCFPYSIFKGPTELIPQNPDSWIPQDVKEFFKTIHKVLDGENGLSILDIPSYLSDHRLASYWDTIRQALKNMSPTVW